jgi:hypothetical protein
MVFSKGRGDNFRGLPTAVQLRTARRLSAPCYGTITPVFHITIGCAPEIGSFRSRVVLSNPNRRAGIGKEEARRFGRPMMRMGLPVRRGGSRELGIVYEAKLG